MTFDKWVEFYNKKNPLANFKRDERLNMVFDEEKGFCEVGFDQDMVYIGQLCGDGRYWFKTVEEVARKLGIHKGGTLNSRSQIKAYMRLFGFKPVEVIDLPDGNKQYIAVRKDDTNKGLRASPAYIYDDGKVSYWVTWDI